MKLADIPMQVTGRRWGVAELVIVGAEPSCEVVCPPASLAELCAWLFTEAGYSFAGLIVEEGRSEWALRYVFYGDGDMGFVHVVLRAPLNEMTVPTVSARVHAADWHEREVEDHFGLVFEGHPRLGDFVLHDVRWQEGVQPMRHGFDGRLAVGDRQPNLNWRPSPIVKAPGSFMMPVGPIFAGITEPVHFLLETVGEDVIRTIPRLFYKYRGLEKIAEGRSVEDVLLLSERFCGTSAVAHGLAFCQAAGADRPSRSPVTRTDAARPSCRVGAHAAPCLRGRGDLRIHRSCGGHQPDCDPARGPAAPVRPAHRASIPLRNASGRGPQHGTVRRRLPARRLRGQDVERKLDRIGHDLRFTSTFLDRIEQVGVTSQDAARSHGLVGPVARAAGISCDLRKAMPYAGYNTLDFQVPVELDGDGYARLRVLLAEARQSARLIDAIAGALPAGPVAANSTPAAGAALGWSEAPRGAAFHWLRVGEDGKVERYRVMPPSFMNWHGFHLAAENFAFQDFPIILATFDLSASENDR